MAVLEGYEFQAETARVVEFLAKCKVSWVFVGNFGEEECVQMAAQFEQGLQT